MKIQLWEVGVLLLCIGLFIVCLSLAFMIVNANSTVKKVDDLVDDNIEDITELIRNISGITGSVNSIINISSKAVGLISGAKVMNNIAKKKNTRRD